MGTVFASEAHAGPERHREEEKDNDRTMTEVEGNVFVTFSMSLMLARHKDRELTKDVKSVVEVEVCPPVDVLLTPVPTRAPSGGCININKHKRGLVDSVQ